MKTIYLNGRFLTQPITGVQRTAIEFTKAIDDLIERGDIDREEYAFKLIYQGRIINRINLKNITIVQKGILSGNLWEQLELPFYTFNDFLVNFCTVGPLLKSNQLVFFHDAATFANPSFFSFSLRSWYKLAFNVLAKTAKYVVTVSEFSKKELIKYININPNKIKVIHNAAQHILNFHEPDQRFKDRIESFKPYCLAVSSLGANKNFKGLSQAIQKIDFKNFNMLIAGGAVATLNNVQVDNTVSYLGYVSDEELKYLYQNAELFVFPSFYEGFGIPPLEAMILGCPVIASGTSSLPEVMGEACHYCDPYDTDDIARQLQLLINSKERLLDLKIKGHERALCYSWSSSALNLLELLS